MKRSTIEQKLNAAMQRKSNAEQDERYLTGQINYHDAEASRIRKSRQAHRSKRDRAIDTIARLNAKLAGADE